MKLLLVSLTKTVLIKLTHQISDKNQNVAKKEPCGAHINRSPAYAIAYPASLGVKGIVIYLKFLGDISLGVAGLLLCGIGVWTNHVTFEQYWFAMLICSSLVAISMLYVITKFEENILDEGLTLKEKAKNCVKDIR